MLTQSMRSAMTDASLHPAARHPRLHLLRRSRSSFFVYLFVYFWTGEGGPTLLAMTLVPVTFVLFVLHGAARRRSLSAPAARRELRHRRDLYRAARLLVSYYMHTEYYALGTSRAGDWNRDRPVHGRRDDGAGPGIFAQAPHAAVRPEHRADPLRGLWLRGPRHVLSCGPELGARHHRHERRDDDRRLLQPAADRAHRGRRVPAGAERAERLRLHRIAAARDQARRHPLAARAAAIGGDRLDVRRHRERQRRGQCHHHRFGDHSRDDRRRHAARDRGRDRVRPPRSAAS